MRLNIMEFPQPPNSASLSEKQYSEAYDAYLRAVVSIAVINKCLQPLPAGTEGARLGVHHGEDYGKVAANFMEAVKLM